ncbi:basement membrane-specific heparan sulfate proteoglycan core protein isoform X2 [Scophthalmus maximus]|uniref:basement membrane-specific heparan sulfate proteoglycan core protein isoform X2 n=1 Tax=Scophthalmus maximus TaxID=52904 RepID=UPI001FA93D88|nr:basement membrane-specific heparan sulfate proteoglycan core protein isoform X2 [Scophthalmus maximus]
MWLIKVFGVIYFTAVCAAQYPPNVTSMPISPTTDVPESMEPSYYLPTTIYEPPVPSLQLQSDWLDVFPSEKVKFICEISGSSDWTISWHRNNQSQDADPNVSFSADGSVLTITAETQMYSGSYFCKGHHKAKAVSTQSSNSLELKVFANKPKPTVSRKPNFDKMFLGESVTFTCAAGDFSGWEYLWYHDGKEIQAPKTDVYTIDSVDHSYSGEYSCKAKRGKGPFYTEESETRSLLVSDPPTTSLKLLSPWLDVFENETVELKCEVEGSDWLTFTWYKNQQKLQTDLDEDSPYLNITQVTQTDQGVYACKVQIAFRNVISELSNNATVIVYENTPKPTLSKVPDFAQMYVGEKVNFTCKVDVSSGWNYKWYINGTLLPSATSKTITSSLSDGGKYSCKATRGEETSTAQSAEIQQDVHEIPVPDLKQTTQWLDVFPTESVKLSCGMAVSSDWTYTWHKDGQRVRPDDTVSFGTNGTTLSITSASAKHAGQYKCSGRLNNRPVNSPITSGLTLSIYDTKPRVTLLRKPEYDVMHTGDPVSFSCHINVSSGWEYLWYKDGSPLAESEKTRNISSVTMKHTGSYTCRVKRGRNAVFQSDPSQTVRLDIQERPQANIILLTGWSEVFSTDSLALRCEVQESQEMWNYTWFREGQPIDLPPSKRHVVTPQNDPEQSLYTCRGISTGRPSYSKLSESFKTKNLLLKRRVLLSISGCLFFGLIAVFLGCIILRILHKPARNEDMLEEENLFLTMAQLKDRTDAPNPLVEYITDEALNASSKEADENGTIFSETTALPISTPEDQAATTEGDGTEEDMGGLISFKQ